MTASTSSSSSTAALTSTGIKRERTSDLPKIKAEPLTKPHSTEPEPEDDTAAAADENNNTAAATSTLVPTNTKTATTKHSVATTTTVTRRVGISDVEARNRSVLLGTYAI